MAHFDHIICDKKDCARLCYGKCFICSQPSPDDLNVEYKKGYEYIHAIGCNYYIKDNKER